MMSKQKGTIMNNSGDSSKVRDDEKQDQTRDMKELNCDFGLMDKVISNYVIVKNIICHLEWQDRLLCKKVCSLWHSVIHALEKEQVDPADFVIDMQEKSNRGGVKLKKSQYLATEPLAIFTFANSNGYTLTKKCKVMKPTPCTPHCEKEHSLIDLVYNHVSAPKCCMVTVEANFLSYMPLPQSITYKHMITDHKYERMSPFVAGVYIPMIPDVQFNVITFKSMDFDVEIYKSVKEITENRYIKGALVYLTDTFILHSNGDRLSFLNYISNVVQPDVPFAMGGCIIENVMFENRDLKEVSDNIDQNDDCSTRNLLSIGIFSIPKNVVCDHFDMYSLIIEPLDWKRLKIQATINEFASKVPRFEHSVALKLSCVGRDQKHEIEQDYFRAAFPTTRLVGCYGNGELGLNHPERPTREEPESVPKKQKRQSKSKTNYNYSYSTVFVYIGWGKRLSNHS